MIGVLIVPTGLGAEIGGHAGDANPVAKLIGACCDKLILHPNVVNASDINEMPDNALYVEGSILDRFLQDGVRLKEVYQNKILVVANGPLQMDTLNAVGAGRATIGIDAEVLELETPFRMVARMNGDVATGDVFGCDELISQVSKYKFDALAIHTEIEVERDVALAYYRNGGVNPWGGVEARASNMVARALNKPVAHAPIESTMSDDEELYYIHGNEEVDPRIAAEAVSICYLHCVLKGLHKAPRVAQQGLRVDDVDFMISPMACWDTPHKACIRADIPIIFVRENSIAPGARRAPPSGIKSTTVDNYWEAAGVIMSMRAGISPRAVRRPLGFVKVLDAGKDGERASTAEELQKKHEG